MIKNIITSQKLLSIKSDNQSSADIFPDNNIIRDLIDTANSHDICRGLAANQIGYYRRIFVIKFGMEFIPIINPKIVCLTGGIKSAMETCLSRPGMRPIKVRRHKIIKIRYLDERNISKIKKFQGMDARIVQHEMDHLEGKLI